MSQHLSSPCKDSDMESVKVYKTRILQESEPDEDSDDSLSMASYKTNLNDLTNSTASEVNKTSFLQESEPEDDSDDTGTTISVEGDVIDLTVSPVLACAEILTDTDTCSDEGDGDFVIDLTNESCISKQVQQYEKTLQGTPSQEDQLCKKIKLCDSSQKLISEYFKTQNPLHTSCTNEMNEDVDSCCSTKSDEEDNPNISINLNLNLYAQNGLGVVTPQRRIEPNRFSVQLSPSLEDLMRPPSSSRPHLPIDLNELNPKNIETPYRFPTTLPVADPRTVNELKDLLYTAVELDQVTPKPERLTTPPRLKVQLLEHQKLGLEFMLKQETGKNKGGILADDMGLGKTIQALAICLQNPSRDPAAKTTLIVAPTTLLYQWEDEINRKIQHSSVFLHYGHKKAKNPRLFNDFEFVLTSYGTLSSEWPSEKKRGKRIAANMYDSDEDRSISGPLFNTLWHRVILDEAHSIKNKGTNAATSACKLDAIHRWCLTGTPIQNSVLDLYSLIRFLEIPPYNELSFFKSQISEPLSRQDKKSIDRLRYLVKSICLRRRKTDLLDGAPLIQLPGILQLLSNNSLLCKIERIVNFSSLQLSTEERSFYDALEKKSQLEFNAYLRNGTVMQHYTYILLLILRLRQAACHPDLVIRSFKKKSEMENQKLVETSEVLVKKLPQNVLKRLLDIPKVSAQECPICLDVAQSALILQNCGHIFCKECIFNNMNQGEIDHRDSLCPSCRGPLIKSKLIDMNQFLLIHKPEEYNAQLLLQEAKEAKDEVDSEEKWISSTKIDKCISLILDIKENAPRDKIIIFSQFLGLLDLMETPLKRSKIKYLRFDGSLTAKERDSMIRTFKTDSSYKVILVSLKCGSLGLNLTCANHVILCDFWWNPAIENQAIDRAHRLGQTKNVTVHRLYMTQTVEDRIFALQEKKQAIADAALGEGSVSGAQARLSINDLMALFDIREGN